MTNCCRRSTSAWRLLRPRRRRLDDRGARDLRGGRRLRRLRAPAGARLGAPRRRRCGADRGRDRQRPDRRPAARRGGPPAGHRGAGGGGTSRRGPALRGRGALRRSVAAGLAAAVLFLPDPAPTLAPAAAENLAATGLGNPVTNVLMAFRAMDTLLEKVVLLLALVGVWSLAPDRLWGGRPGPRHQADPHGVLAFLARLLPPVGHRRGHLHPLGRAPTIPAARSRAARSSPPCGCWS